MNYSENLQLNMPEPADQFNLEHWNENMDIVDANVHDLQNQINAEVERATQQEETNRNVNKLIGTLPISQGGTGKVTNQDALNELHKNVVTQDNIDDNDEITFIRRTPEDIYQGISESIDVKDVTLTTLAEKVFELLKTDGGKVFNANSNGFTPKTDSKSSLNFLRADGIWGVPNLQEDVVNVEFSDSYNLNSNSIFKITATSEITILLSNPSKVGITVTIINDSDTLTHHLSTTNVKGDTVDSILPNSYFKIAWNGKAWVNITAPAVESSFTQYPKQKTPEMVYPCTKWKVVNYNGAFFRAEGGNAASFIEEGKNLVKQADAIKTHTTGGMSANAKGYIGYGIPSQNPYASGNVTLDDRRGDTSLWGDHSSYLCDGYDIDVSHVHTYDGDIETRPQNYTYRIWKRIS